MDNGGNNWFITDMIDLKPSPQTQGNFLISCAVMILRGGGHYRYGLGDKGKVR